MKELEKLKGQEAVSFLKSNKGSILEEKKAQTTFSSPIQSKVRKENESK